MPMPIFLHHATLRPRTRLPSRSTTAQNVLTQQFSTPNFLSSTGAAVGVAAVVSAALCDFSSAAFRVSGIFLSSSAMVVSLRHIVEVPAARRRAERLLLLYFRVENHLGAVPNALQAMLVSIYTSTYDRTIYDSPTVICNSKERMRFLQTPPP